MVEEIQAKSILNPTGGFLATYTHSLNAYQGCAFGKNSCPYCYVRAMPVQRFSGRPWGEWVKAKVNAPELLKRDLEAAKRKGTFGNLRIFMSTATDPYQGAEARLKLTRGILEVFAGSGETPPDDAESIDPRRIEDAGRDQPRPAVRPGNLRRTDRGARLSRRG